MGAVVKNLLYESEDMDSTPGQGTKISCFERKVSPCAVGSIPARDDPTSHKAAKPICYNY